MHTNRLSRETSPYLLQHAHNPVDWYPWGPEAFEAARGENKPIFLSVGYSTCYWCHVMERQSFENEAIAAEMNRRFINVKVDREERPDVDQLYMNAVQVLSGHGGWPMSVFLLPDLRPFYGGTYYPPGDMHGRIGFPRLLAAIEGAYLTRREEVEKSARQIVAALQRMAVPAAGGSGPIDAVLVENLLEESTSDYDERFGGFGAAPKFPRETLLELILTSQKTTPNPTRLRQVLDTLDAMANGGIHDHLGGAFHRYSTDEKWLVPHFEIMLYDNAMLAGVYAEAFSQTQEARYATTARGILDFVLREMTSGEGAFFTAIDAEVDAQEGMPYLWTAAEIAEALGGDADLFCRAYGVDLGPNFSDPHQGSGALEKNVLFVAEPMSAELDKQLAPLREKLYEHRRKRKQPLLDTKVLTSWNSLMITAMARVGKILNEPKFTAAANRAADYLLKAHRKADSLLVRSSRDGQAKGEAFLDDYAFLAEALLECGREDEARSVGEKICERFLDRELGGFFFTAEGSEMIVRQKTASDSPLPAGNAVAADVMRRLGEKQIARDAIAVFAGQIERYGSSMSAMVKSALLYIHDNGPLVGAGEVEDSDEVVSISTNWKSADRLEIALKIAEGFHVNGPNAIVGLVPTRLNFQGEITQSIEGIDYPQPATRTFPFADGSLEVYEGELVIGVRFSRSMRGKSIAMSLQYQACDESSCREAVKRRLTAEAKEDRDG